MVHDGTSLCMLLANTLTVYVKILSPLPTFTYPQTQVYFTSLVHLLPPPSKIHANAYNYNLLEYALIVDLVKR